MVHFSCGGFCVLMFGQMFSFPSFFFFFSCSCCSSFFFFFFFFFKLLMLIPSSIFFKRIRSLSPFFSDGIHIVMFFESFCPVFVMGKKKKKKKKFLSSNSVVFFFVTLGRYVFIFYFFFFFFLCEFSCYNERKKARVLSCIKTVILYALLIFTEEKIG